MRDVFNKVMIYLRKQLHKLELRISAYSATVAQLSSAPAVAPPSGAAGTGAGDAVATGAGSGGGSSGSGCSSGGSTESVASGVLSNSQAVAEGDEGAARDKAEGQVRQVNRIWACMYAWGVALTLVLTGQHP